MRTEQISGAGQVFSLLALSQSFWLLCSRPPLANGLLTAAAGAAAYGVVFFLAVLCRRAAAMEKSLSKGSAAAGMLLAAGYFSVTAGQLLTACRVLFDEAFSPFFLLAVLLIADPVSRYMAAFLLATHLGGCVGDLYDTGLYLFRFRDPDTLMQDTGPKQTFYTRV